MSSTPGSMHTAHPATATTATYRPGRRRTGGHIAAIVIGCLVLLPGLGMVAGGAAVAIGNEVATDDDGYFTVTLDRIESDGMAITTSDLLLDDVDDDEPWVLDWLDLDVRLRVDGAGPTDEVFVGIARSADVADYLAGAPHSEVVEIDDHTAQYRQVAGAESARAVGSPLDQDIWVASASGPGEQVLSWDARGGRWSVVVMNADGSADVAADVEIGARSDAITPIAITLLIIGGLTVVFSVACIVIGARGRRTPDAPQSDRPVSTGPLAPPTPESAVALDDETRSPTPVG